MLDLYLLISTWISVRICVMDAIQKILWMLESVERRLNVRDGYDCEASSLLQITLTFSN